MSNNTDIEEDFTAIDDDVTVSDEEEVVDDLVYEERRYITLRNTYLYIKQYVQENYLFLAENLTMESLLDFLDDNYHLL